MFTFVRNFLGVKTDQAVQAGVEALVRWDPQAATEAELRTMEHHLDELGLQVAQARAAYDRERQEAVAIKGLLQQRMAAAEQLERQRAIEPAPERKVALEKSLATLVGMLEQMTPDVEREAQDETEAQEFLASWRRPMPRRAPSSGLHAVSSSGPSAIWDAPNSGGRWPSGRPRRHGRRRGSATPRIA